MSRPLLIFSATDSASGNGAYAGYSSLWASDGTAAGTYEIGGTGNAGVAGVGPGSLEPAFITPLNGLAVFMGLDQDGKSGLWATDGTVAGTKEIGGLRNAGVVGASTTMALFPNYGIVALNGKAFFGGKDATGSVGLWVTDGTAAGTVEIGGLANNQIAGASQGGLTPYNFVVSNGRVFFQGVDINGAAGIWVTDGTVAGTHEVGGVGAAGVAGTQSGGGYGMGFNYPAALKNGVVFNSISYPPGVGSLWFTDGTANGTAAIGGAANTGIAGINQNWGLDPIFSGAAGDKVFFGGFGGSKEGLWVTDGTAAGTYEVGGLDNAGVAGVDKINGLEPTNFTYYNGKIYFQGLDATGHQALWTSDGTAAGTYEIGGLGNSGVAGAVQGGLYPSSMTVANGFLYFAGRDSAGLPGLWKTDGTAAGTVEIVDSSRFSFIGSHGPSGGVSNLTAVESFQAGPYATNLSGPGGQVYRLYGAVLNRQPDNNGFQFWVTQLNAGQSLANITAGFVNSPEFQSRYGALDNTQFVTQLYSNVLNRAPDQTGLANWVNNLNGGGSRAAVVDGFSESAEYQNNTAIPASGWATTALDSKFSGQVYRLYGATLNRQPDNGGLQFWVDHLNAGQSLASITAGFVNSPEFQSRYGALDNAQFVTLLYKNVLNRAPDPTGLTSWVNNLNGGASRESVVDGFSESTEYQNNTASAFSTFMQTSLSDVLYGTGGNDTLLGGQGVDTFRFDLNTPGADQVYGLQPWDVLNMVNFGYSSASDVMSHMSQSGANVLFADRGETITFYDATVSAMGGLSYNFK